MSEAKEIYEVVLADLKKEVEPILRWYEERILSLEREVRILREGSDNQQVTAFPVSLEDVRVEKKKGMISYYDEGYDDVRALRIPELTESGFKIEEPYIM